MSTMSWKAHIRTCTQDTKSIILYKCDTKLLVIPGSVHYYVHVLKEDVKARLTALGALGAGIHDALGHASAALAGALAAVSSTVGRALAVGTTATVFCERWGGRN